MQNKSIVFFSICFGMCSVEINKEISLWKFLAGDRNLSYVFESFIHPDFFEPSFMTYSGLWGYDTTWLDKLWLFNTSTTNVQYGVLKSSISVCPMLNCSDNHTINYIIHKHGEHQLKQQKIQQMLKYILFIKCLHCATLLCKIHFIWLQCGTIGQLIALLCKSKKMRALVPMWSSLLCDLCFLTCKLSRILVEVLTRPQALYNTKNFPLGLIYDLMTWVNAAMENVW